MTLVQACEIPNTKYAPQKTGLNLSSSSGAGTDGFEYEEEERRMKEKKCIPVMVER